MNFSTQDYNSGFNIISSDQIREINNAINKCNIKCKKGNIPVIREKLHNDLMSVGWSPEVQIDPNSRISITSFKDNIGLCIQTGNMGRMYADLLKLQTIFQKKIVNGAIYILPLKNTAKEMGDNIVHYERLLRELQIFENVITIPLVIYGFHE